MLIKVMSVLLFNIVSILGRKKITKYIYSGIERELAVYSTESLGNKILMNSIVFIILVNLGLLVNTRGQYIVIGILLFLIVEPFIFARRRIEEIRKQLFFEFPIWIRQIQCLLVHNTVYQSLEKSVKHAPLMIQSELPYLMESLRKNPNDIEMYQHFLSSYDNEEVRKTMRLLYRYNLLGSNDSQIQLNRVIDSCSKTLETRRTERTEAEVLSSSMYGLLPILITSGLFIIHMVLMMKIMFERG